MATEANAEAPCAPDIDERGVDRAQIRKLLSLSPLERVLWVQELWSSIESIRRINGTSSPR